MIVGSLARRYAKAILAIAITEKNHEKVNAELDTLATLYKENLEFRDVLENAIFPLSERRKVLETVSQRLALSKTTLNLALLLLSRGKIAYLPNIAREFRSLLDQHVGRIRGTVTSVVPLDLATELRLKTLLERISEKKVILEKVEDPRLIGGFLLQVGDVVYDGSVFTQLQYLKRQLSGE